MDRNAYTSRFATLAEAVEYEALAIGSEYLPTSARQVRDGREPTEAYWRWLCDQIDAGKG